MSDFKKIVLFQSKQIRRIWHEEEWWFSIIDVCAALTDSANYQKSRKYWNKLNQRLREEGSEVVTFCHRLKLPASDGKNYLTDCANAEGLLRIVQSIPSRKAEPFKRWLAQFGYQRIQEIENPELAQERMKKIYEQKGYSKDWIDKRIRGIAIRQNLTEEWKEREIEKQKDYSILTAEISKKEKPEGLPENKTVAQRGGTVAGKAREETEKELGESVISAENYLNQTEHKKNLN